MLSSFNGATSPRCGKAWSECECLSNRGMPVSDSLTQHDTKASIHTYSSKNNNTADDVASLPHQNMAISTSPPPTKRNRPKPAPTKSPLKNPPRNTSVFHLPKAQARRFHTTPPPPGPLAISPSPSFPTQEIISHFLDHTC
jgi:hypothetical protein